MKQEEMGLRPGSGKAHSRGLSKSDYVIAGENMGPSKLQKAASLGVPILSESDFLDML